MSILSDTKTSSETLEKQRNGKAELLIGTKFGFDFDITDAELRLYNCRIQDPLKKVSSVFTRIQ